MSDEKSIAKAAEEVGGKVGRYVSSLFSISHLFSPYHPIQLHPTYSLNIIIDSFRRSVDAIVNNAGITMDAPPATGSLFSRINAAIATNASGPAAVVESFTPLLEKSTHSTPRIVNVSSGAGSITMRLDTTNPFRSMISVPYRTSKAALNMVTACQAYELGQRGWKVFIYCPGFTVSNLSVSLLPDPVRCRCCWVLLCGLTLIY